MSQIFRVDGQTGGGIERISIDKDVVDRGDVINWTATDLVMQLDYRVGIYVEAINYVYNPIRFVADSRVKTGQYTVPNDIPYGQHKFVLQVWEEFYWRTTDYKPITVAPRQPPGPPPGPPPPSPPPPSPPPSPTQGPTPSPPPGSTPSPSPSLAIPTWVLIVIGAIVVIILLVILR
jgi:hypothetical protein